MFFFLFITIPRAVKSQTGKWIYDKLHYYVYCGKGLQSVGRHLQRKRKREKDVQFLTKCTAEEKARKLDELRRKGDFHRNMKVPRIGGEFVVWRRASIDMIVDCKDYLPCEHCLVFVTRKEL